MKTSQQYRQGDVLIERIAKMPTSTTPVARDAGRVILAYGEVTGHAHAIVEDITTARAAVAWTFGKEADEYAQTVES
jgi:hypothetical protein